MIENNCRNCQQTLKGKYCENCGQAADIDQLTVKYIFLHDFIHGVFHLDKGILFTIKELFTRPGHSIREYVEGKRVSHFNYFTLIAILLLIEKLIGEFSSVRYTEFEIEYSKEVLNSIDLITRKYAKIFILSTIPFQALISYFFFRRKESYASHLVINTYLAAGRLLFNVSFVMITIFIVNTDYLAILWIIVEFSKIAYSCWFLYQYFSDFNFTKAGLFQNSLLSSTLIYLFVFGFAGLLIFA